MVTYSAAMPSPIRDHFLADHQRLEDLLERLLAAFEADNREDMTRLWSELESGLCAHLHAEETYLFPVVLRTSERTARVLFQEHRHIRARLAELGVALDLHAVRLDVARGFIDELRAHARNEDRLLYSCADDHIDELQRASILAATQWPPSDQATTEARRAVSDVLRDALPAGVDASLKEAGT